MSATVEHSMCTSCPKHLAVGSVTVETRGTVRITLVHHLTVLNLWGDIQTCLTALASPKLAFEPPPFPSPLPPKKKHEPYIQCLYYTLFWLVFFLWILDGIYFTHQKTSPDLNSSMFAEVSTVIALLENRKVYLSPWPYFEHISFRKVIVMFSR